MVRCANGEEGTQPIQRVRAAQELLSEPLKTASRLWFEAGPELRPRPSEEAVKYFDGLVTDWADDVSLPLLVRKAGKGLLRGVPVPGPDGREVIPVDNSPAQWMFMLALHDLRPTLLELAEELRSGATWLTKQLTREEAQKRREHYPNLTPSKFSPQDVNALGWKLVHIKPIGLKKRGLPSQQSLESLRTHHLCFLQPSNMFVIPKQLAGLAEIDAMTSAFESRESTKPQAVGSPERCIYVICIRCS